MVAEPSVLIPLSAADAIRNCGADWGWLDLVIDRREGLYVVAGWSKAERLRLPAAASWLTGHYTAHHATTPCAAVWYRVDGTLHDWGQEARNRRVGLTVDGFRQRVRSGWRQPPAAGFPVITYCDDPNEHRTRWAAWQVHLDRAERIQMDVFDEDEDLLAPLDRGWPRQDLRDKLVTVVGVGSVGSAACEALASYGIRRFALIDPDRLFSHNFARHRVLRRHTGRLKVNAVAELLTERDPTVDVDRYPLDVAVHADLVRGVFARSDIILGCSDGTLSRRTISHLAFRADRPAVLACVLEQGAFGEILRLRPGYTGCLLCNRAALSDVFDPEPGLDAGYETGNPHLPMTAVTGDLAAIGQLAAKAVVATLMIQLGDRSQRLAGDHAVVALRPAPDFPAPFDVELAGEVRWRPIAAPRIGECPTCGVPA